MPGQAIFSSNPLAKNQIRTRAKDRHPRRKIVDAGALSACPFAPGGIPVAWRATRCCRRRVEVLQLLDVCEFWVDALELASTPPR